MSYYKEFFSSAPWVIIQDLRSCAKNISSQDGFDTTLAINPRPFDLQLANYFDLFEVSLRGLLSLGILDRKYLEEDGYSPEMPDAVATCLGTLCDHLETVVDDSLALPTTTAIRETDFGYQYPNLRALISCLKTVVGTRDVRTLFRFPTARMARESYRVVRFCHTQLSKLDHQPQGAQAANLVQDWPVANTSVESQHREYCGQVFDILLQELNECTMFQASEHEVLVEAMDKGQAGPTQLLNWFFSCPKIKKLKEIQCRPMSSSQSIRKESITTSSLLNVPGHGRNRAEMPRDKSLSFCKELQESWWLNQRLRVQSNEQGFFLDTENGTISSEDSGRNLTDAKKKSLETLIKKGVFQRLRPTNYRSKVDRFNHLEKRSLAFKLALNLLAFIDSKHTIPAWDPQYIHFFRTRHGRYEKATALLTCLLGENSRKFLDIPHVEQSVVFTAFAKLLLEIEYGDRFEINLVERYQEGWNELREFLSKAEQDCDSGDQQYLLAVAACLHFESLYKKEHRRQNAAGNREDGFVTLRRLIRHKIVSNLVNSNVRSTNMASNRKRSANEQEEVQESDLEHDSLSTVLPIRETTVPNGLPDHRGKRTKRNNNRAGSAEPIAHDSCLNHPECSIDDTRGLSFGGAAYNSTNGSGINTGDELLASKEWNPDRWLKRIDYINEEIRSLGARGRVGIAVLDTGCDPQGTGGSWFKAYPEEVGRIADSHWRDFVSTAEQPVDDDERGHGTAVVSLLLRVARHADVFVGRIARSSNDLHIARENVAAAIEYAANEWDVDIVTMSFGFDTGHELIERAIRRAEDVRKRHIVFFAAAANDGANRKEMFPAYLSSVISVRGTDHDGSFIAAYNPQPTANNNFSPLYGTLGLKVPLWPSSETVSGCSISTPIMAAMVSLVFQLASCRNMDEHCQTKLRTLEGVQQLLRGIAVDQGNNRYYVHLWGLFTRRPNWERDLVQRIEVAMRDLPG